MKKFINLYIENGIVIYQKTDRKIKIDDEYDAYILGEAKMAGTLNHELTPKFIMKILQELDGEKTKDGGETTNAI